MTFITVRSRYLLCVSFVALIIGLTLGHAELIDRTLAVADKDTLKTAQEALHDQFTFQGITGSALTINHESGDYDWQHRGPNNDKQWAWFLNRHRYFEDLYRAYQSTNDSAYAEKIISILSDWLEAHPSPPLGISFSSAWRPLEVARRVLESWDIVYLCLWNDPHFPEQLRKPFKASLQSHGDYLLENHAMYGNHLITEMLALLKVSILLADTKPAERWKDYALQKLEEQYDKQVYPEGAHKELSSHYQRVVSRNYQHLLVLLEHSGEAELIKKWRPKVDRLWKYFAQIRKPDGYAPLNNDSDLENIAKLLPKSIYKNYKKTSSSIYFPNAGQVILRGSTSADILKLWAFFDIGPRGTDHQHADFLHLSISHGSSNYLVDNGRYTYQLGPWRDYFKGPTAHNIIEMIGLRPQQMPKESIGPLPGTGYAESENWTAAWGEQSFQNLWGEHPASWQRTVVELTNIGLLVIDRILTFSPQQIRGYWHASPNYNWQIDAPPYQLLDGSNKLQISTCNTTGSDLDLAIIEGQMHPEVQGWHSKRFNKKKPAPTLVYQSKVNQPVVIAWLLATCQSQAELEAVEESTQGTLKINLKNGNTTHNLRLRTASAKQAFELLF